ncbi:MAG: hypothetical protein RIE86_27965, partial [Imperialibacter sp.]
CLHTRKMLPLQILVNNPDQLVCLVHVFGLVRHRVTVYPLHTGNAHGYIGPGGGVYFDQDYLQVFAVVASFECEDTP